MGLAYVVGCTVEVIDCVCFIPFSMFLFWTPVCDKRWTVRSHALSLIVVIIRVV